MLLLSFSSIVMNPRTAKSTIAAVMSRMSTELSISVPTSLGVSMSGGSYCAAMGRSRGSRPRVHHSQNIPKNAKIGTISGQLLRTKSTARSIVVGS